MAPQSYPSPLVFGPLLPFCLRSSSMAASTSAEDSSFQRRKVTMPSFESYLWAPWVSSGYFAERRGYQRIRGVIPKLGGGTLAMHPAEEIAARRTAKSGSSWIVRTAWWKNSPRSRS